MNTLLFSFILLLLTQDGNQKFTANFEPTVSFYEMGERLVDNGNWKLALHVWLQGVNQKKDYNPILGLSAISVATENQAKEYYPFISEAYFQSIKNLNFENHKDLLKEQINYIIPILPEMEKNKWEKKLKSNDNSITSDIIGFWKTENPYPSTSYNERLIEHWERIAYARTHFTKAKNSPYKTDDRGTIYVRFGQPHRTVKQTIRIDEIQDPSTGNFFRIFTNATIDFELWSYYDHTDNIPPVYIFGKTDGVGQYRLQNSIIDMIPIAGNQFSGSQFEQSSGGSFLNSGLSQTNSDSSSQLSVNSQSIGGAPLRRSTVKFMLHYGFLEKLAFYHEYFGDLFDEMTSDILSTGAGPGNFSFNLAARSLQGVHSEQEKRIAYVRDINAPANQSYLIANDIKSEFNSYQFFTPSGETEQFFFIRNNYDFIENRSKNLEEYNSLLTLEYFDESWNSIEKQKFLLDLNDDLSTNFSFNENGEEKLQIIYSFELIKNEGVRKKDANSFEIIGSTGSKSIPIDNSSKIDNTFNVSDILFGIYNSNGEGRNIITPLFENIYKNNDELGVYFEVFSITDSHFSVTFQIEQKNFWGKWKEVSNKSSVTVDYEKNDDRSQNWFKFDLTDLKKKDARITLNFNAASLDKSIQKIIPIKVE